MSFCALPIGDKRCRAMEKVFESISIPCSVLGCTKNVCYGELSAHEKEWKLSLCSCPVPDSATTLPHTRISMITLPLATSTVTAGKDLCMICSHLGFPLFSSWTSTIRYQLWGNMGTVYCFQFSVLESCMVCM